MYSKPERMSSDSDRPERHESYTGSWRSFCFTAREGFNHKSAIVSRVMRKFVCTLRALSQILRHHTADGLRCFDLHGVGGVRVGAQDKAGIATHLYFLPKAKPEERNRRPGGSFPLVNNLFAEHLMSCGAVILTVSYAPAPPHFRRFPPR